MYEEMRLHLGYRMLLEERIMLCNHFDMPLPYPLQCAHKILKKERTILHRALFLKEGRKGPS